MLVVVLGVLAALLVYASSRLGLDAPLVVLVVFGSLVVFFGVVLARKFRQMQALVTANQDALAKLHQGKALEALQAFEACEASAVEGRFRQLELLFASNRAAALSRLGRTREAVALCRELRGHSDVSRHLKQQWGVFISVCVTAELLLPEPDLDAARRLLDQDGAVAAEAHRAGLLLPRCMLLLRAGHFAEVDPLLQAQWSNADALLGARQLRQLQLLWAFALHQSGRTVDARRRLDAAGPDIVAEAKVLVQGWPELARFVAGLAEYRGAAL